MPALRPTGACLLRWTRQQPWLCLRGTDAQAAQWPGRYFHAPMPPALGHDLWLAYGRDAFRGPWRDTVQLDYRHPELRRTMCGVLVS